ncbi:L-dopachrome tautomerase-related protein [Enterococcus sp. HY326]|uniref:L-dopachrome tautomerase-related protein n=1 Tax=Enterococcus sp. HY326 TaxID=2971265 RepID=UPI0022402375|nr:L-dopachrome tautomerase-related protein [Enterococcus sp. HY326]
MFLPTEKNFGELEQVHAFYDEMPTGVSISENGRIFVNFPEWGDKVKATVAEIVGEQVIPYPNQELNTFNSKYPQKAFLSVQSIVADGAGTLWVLDTAAPNFSVPIEGGAKLVAIDLATNTVKKVYSFSEEVVLPTTYLNDVRIDLRRNAEGVAYITDSSIKGPGAIIVLDLATGDAFRILDGSISTAADPSFLPKVEGEILMNRDSDGSTSPWQVAVDGIAISPGGKILYFSPLSSRHLYSIETDLIFDSEIADQDLAKHVKDWGEKGASDGMITAEDGTVYAGDYENNSIRAIHPDGTMSTVVHDSRILWPDTLSIGSDKYLYFNANQLQRQAGFHRGIDLREKPYSLFRIYIGKGPAKVK